MIETVSLHPAGGGAEPSCAALREELLPTHGTGLEAGQHERCRGDSDNDVSGQHPAVVCGAARSNYIRLRPPPWRDRKLDTLF